MTWKKTAGSPFETYKHDAVATNGMVATNHPLGSLAGLEMLALGGNAMDAAVASAFALSVVEPMMIGIFGAGFINYYNASNDEFVNIDNYAVAPLAATPDMYETVSDTWPDYMETADRENLVGYLAVGVPGALKGWCYAEEHFGRLGLDTVIQPAVRFAKRGFPASRYMVNIIHQSREDLAMFPASADVFLPGGSPPSVGDLVVRKIMETRWSQSLGTDRPCSTRAALARWWLKTWPRTAGSSLPTTFATIEYTCVSP